MSVGRRRRCTVRAVVHLHRISSLNIITSTRCSMVVTPLPLRTLPVPARACHLLLRPTLQDTPRHLVLALVRANPVILETCQVVHIRLLHTTVTAEARQGRDTRVRIRGIFSCASLGSR